MKKKKIMIVPIFIPHQGCPYRCVFCSQVDITGARTKTDQNHVLEVLKTYLGQDFNSNRSSKCEVAFYGGSFTGLPMDRQKILLSVIKPFIEMNCYPYEETKARDCRRRRARQAPAEAEATT